MANYAADESRVPRKSLVLFLLVLLLVSSACSKPETLRPLILDEADLLSSEVEEWIESYPFPQGYNLIVRTVDNIPAPVVGARADELFEQSAEDSGDDEDALEERGVFVLASREPRLVQVRVGSELYGACRWGGLIAGPEYIEMQSVTSGDSVDAAMQFVLPWLAERLPRTMSSPRFKQVILQQISGILGNELEELSLPSQNFYGHYMLRPMLQLRVAERALWESWWFTYVLVAIVIELLRRAVESSSRRFGNLALLCQIPCRGF